MSAHSGLCDRRIRRQRRRRRRRRVWRLRMVRTILWVDRVLDRAGDLGVANVCRMHLYDDSFYHLSPSSVCVCSRVCCVRFAFINETTDSINLLRARSICRIHQPGRIVSGMLCARVYFLYKWRPPFRGSRAAGSGPTDPTLQKSIDVRLLLYIALSTIIYDTSTERYKYVGRAMYVRMHQVQRLIVITRETGWRRCILIRTTQHPRDSPNQD